MMLGTVLIKVHKLPHILSGFGRLANDDIGEVDHVIPYPTLAEQL